MSIAVNGLATLDGEGKSALSRGSERSKTPREHATRKSIPIDRQEKTKATRTSTVAPTFLCIELNFLHIKSTISTCCASSFFLSRIPTCRCSVRSKLVFPLVSTSLPESRKARATIRLLVKLVHITLRSFRRVAIIFAENNVTRLAKYFVINAINPQSIR